MSLCICPNPENARHGVTPHISGGLWVIMTGQCRLIGCNKCATLVGDVDRGGYAWWGGWREGRGYMGNWYTSLSLL